MKKIILSLSSLVLITLLIGSCKKAEVDTETQSATDNATCEAEFMALPSNTNNRAVTKTGVAGYKVTESMALYPTITIDSSVAMTGSANKMFPRLMTIDFGTAGVIDPTDGKLRSGIITIKYDTFWVTTMGKPVNAVMKFINYKVNGTDYNADSITIRKSGNSQSIAVINGSCWNSNWHLDWSGTRTITATVDGSGNITSVSITGNAKGKNKNGLSYTADITSPIVKSTSCQWIESGVLEITPEGKATRTLDYSEGGGCDNKASLTIKGNKFVFSMN